MWKVKRHYVTATEMKNKCSQFLVKSCFHSSLWSLVQDKNPGAFGPGHFKQIKGLCLLFFILMKIISNTSIASIIIHVEVG